MLQFIPIKTFRNVNSYLGGVIYRLSSMLPSLFIYFPLEQHVFPSNSFSNKTCIPVVCLEHIMHLELRLLHHFFNKRHHFKTNWIDDSLNYNNVQYLYPLYKVLTNQCQLLIVSLKAILNLNQFSQRCNKFHISLHHSG